MGRNRTMILQMLIMLACFSTSNADLESDISCLRSIKASLEVEHPSSIFSTWDFEGSSICHFSGVGCWQDNNNTVFSIILPDEGLTGPFPTGIRNCTSMQRLNLANNHLSGPIPSNIGDLLPFIVYVNLSNNTFSGTIPASIVNWRYINVMRLENNRLTGEIPPGLTGLYRIKVFNVSNNRLSGHVPTFGGSRCFSAESYANNPGLCGGPLKACKDDDDDDNLFLSGFSVGFPLFTILTLLFMFYYFPKNVCPFY